MLNLKCAIGVNMTCGHVSISFAFSFLYFVFAGVPMYDIKFNTNIDDVAITSEGKRN